MQPAPNWVPYREPLKRTLVRNVAIAVAVGAGIAAASHRLPLLLPASILALWFSLGGHYVEVLFLNGVRPRIPHQRAVQVATRAGVWFFGGCLLYLLMAATAHALPVRPPRAARWWTGGLMLIAIELVVHSVLARRGAPNFYDGDG